MPSWEVSIAAPEPWPGQESLMASRSAHATIKGYFYQFDHTIIQLLSAANADAVVVVEGIEDVDLTDGRDEVLIQCKYYEGTQYNHSVIKDAVIQMVRHFHSNGCKASKSQKYRIYGHYGGGQDKLPDVIDVEFLKQHFLTFSSEKIITLVHVDLGLDDTALKIFLSRLEINIFGISYDSQQIEIEKLLISQILECNKEDVRTFFYPLAISKIQSISIESKPKDRTLTKRAFIDAISRKEIVFSYWLQRKFGEDYYESSIKRKYFTWRTTKAPKKARFFIIELFDQQAVEKIVSMLADIGRKFSHVELTRTPPEDRFCPYIYLHGLTRDELIQTKGKLRQAGIEFRDGHEYDGAPFSPESLVVPPTKERLTQLKFIGHAEQVESVMSLIRNTEIEVFEFFKEAPIDRKLVPTSVVHHDIRIASVSTIQKVI
jgi:hypothetical protein